MPWFLMNRSASAMMFPSATTGQPKGILRDLPAAGPGEPLPVIEFVRAMFAFREVIDLTSIRHRLSLGSPGQRIRSAAPGVHGYCDGTFRSRAVAGSCRALPVTHCLMVPVMFNRLLRMPDDFRARYDTSSLECILHASAPCLVHVKQAMIVWLGPIIPEYYSATEANGFTFCNTAEWLAHPGTVGRPILGELLILDGEGNQCPAGVDGTIWFRGATAFEYFQDPVKTAESRSSDGTASAVGDVGHVDADGYLYLTDRTSYMIISGGVNIYPQETENILSAHPAVLDVTVIGVPIDDLGEEVTGPSWPPPPRPAARPSSRRSPAWPTGPGSTPSSWTPPTRWCQGSCSAKRPAGPRHQRRTRRLPPRRRRRGGHRWPST